MRIIPSEDKVSFTFKGRASYKIYVVQIPFSGLEATNAQSNHTAAGVNFFTILNSTTEV